MEQALSRHAPKHTQVSNQFPNSLLEHSAHIQRCRGSLAQFLCKASDFPLIPPSNKHDLGDTASHLIPTLSLQEEDKLPKDSRSPMSARSKVQRLKLSAIISKRWVIIITWAKKLHSRCTRQSSRNAKSLSHPFSLCMEGQSDFSILSGHKAKK